jgi:hypothetical protein
MSTAPVSEISSESGGQTQKERIRLEATLDNLDEQMLEAKRFLRQLNKNMGVRSGIAYRIANFMFLAVIFGIEFDMNGFLCSATTYWDYDIFLLRFLLIFFVLAFVIPVLLAFFMQLESESGAGGATGGAGGAGPPPRQPLSGLSGSARTHKGSGYLPWLRGTITSTNPFGGQIKFYHVIPGVRFYLLLKPTTDMVDVDSIFRINSLSSFTFGFYQIMGIVFTYVEAKELNLFVYLNIASQAVNWSITILYFVTPISVWMGRAQEARTKSRFYQGLMNEWSSRYCEHDAVIFESNSDEEIGQIETRKEEVKKRLAKRISSAFAGKKSKSGKDIGQFGLEKMRDLDVRDFLEIMRDQAIASLEMKNGQ